MEPPALHQFRTAGEAIATIHGDEYEHQLPEHEEHPASTRDLIIIFSVFAGVIICCLIAVFMTRGRTRNSRRS